MLNYRPMLRRDRDAVDRLLQRCGAPIPASQRSAGAEAFAGLCWVAETRDGEVVAAIEADAEARQLAIRTLVVDPRFQSKGIAQRLISITMNELGTARNARTHAKTLVDQPQTVLRSYLG